jgi:predicted HicB family RNase H-like nuclease
MERQIPEINSHPTVCLRVSPEDKERFKVAAKADGKALGTWLRWLARQRIEQQNRSN